MTAAPQPPRQFYSVYDLIDDVQTLLWERGLNPGPQLAHRAMAVAAAGQLLRSFGITPASDPEDVIGKRGTLDSEER